MLAHYRRLYSAKCGVDTSTPAYFKPRYKPRPRPSLPVADMASHPQLTNKDMKFLKNLAGEVRTWWNRGTPRHSAVSCGEKKCIDKAKGISQSSPSGQGRSCNGLYEHEEADHNVHSVTALNVKNSPKKRKDLNLKRCALAYGVSSKLREMNVYHPPRRRLGTGIANKYCGQCALKINKGSHMGASGDIAATSNLFANEISSIIEEQKEELLYLHFIQDITQDILSNEVYSNDGVMMIFKKHLCLNREKLHRDKMIKELQKLGLKIGLPHYNYSAFFGSNSVSLGEQSGENSDYEYYEDYHSKVKSSTSLNFNHKTDSMGDLNEILSSSMSERGEEMELVKQGEICEKKKKESKVLGFLEEMGFDSNIAEEICVCMTDKDFSKFQFASNESDTNTGFHGDFAKARDGDSFDCKKEHPSKSVTELFHYCDAGFVFGDGSKTQSSIIFDQEDTMEMERILESIHDGNTERDDIGSIPAVSSSVRSKSRESERESPFEADLHGESIKEKNSKKVYSEQKCKANSASPMGSDYSSMKDHDESIYEGYSEEQDEGQESASEEAEEIPEDLSQSSVSSGISQITEKLKEFNVDMNTMVHSRSSERNNLSSDNNSNSLRELVL
ncbi:hypothetical protein R5R35_001893 [Gryllus longicercus]